MKKNNENSVISKILNKSKLLILMSFFILISFLLGELLEILLYIVVLILILVVLKLVLDFMCGDYYE